MRTAEIPLARLTEHAIHVLAREIGVVNTMRFLNQFSSGVGNYTRDRDAPFRGITIDDVLAAERDGGTPPAAT